MRTGGQQTKPQQRPQGPHGARGARPSRLVRRRRGTRPAPWRRGLSSSRPLASVRTPGLAFLGGRALRSQRRGRWLVALRVLPRGRPGHVPLVSVPCEYAFHGRHCRPATAPATRRSVNWANVVTYTASGSQRGMDCSGWKSSTRETSDGGKRRFALFRKSALTSQRPSSPSAQLRV